MVERAVTDAMWRYLAVVAALAAEAGQRELVFGAVVRSPCVVGRPGRPRAPRAAAPAPRAPASRSSSSATRRTTSTSLVARGERPRAGQGGEVRQPDLDPDRPPAPARALEALAEPLAEALQRGLELRSPRAGPPGRWSRTTPTWPRADRPRRARPRSGPAPRGGRPAGARTGGTAAPSGLRPAPRGWRCRARPAARRSAGPMPGTRPGGEPAKRSRACSRVSARKPSGFSASEATLATSLLGPMPIEHTSPVRSSTAAFTVRAVACGQPRSLRSR